MKKNLLLISMLIYLIHIVPPTNGKSSNKRIFGTTRNSKFISFNTNSGKIEMALDLSLPFLSIPLGDKNDNSGILVPSLNINPKTLAILSVITLLTTTVFPWFLKQKQLTHPPDSNYSKEHKRTNRELDFLFLEDSINEILFQNNQVTPCIQCIICKAVASATHSHNPSNIEKIIDDISSHTWINNATNGTVIKDAIWKGRKVMEPDECITVYKECALSQQIIKNILKMIGI